ncbi:MAG: PorT family protein [Tannerella sp.]|jgi:hypothetical protein|nr:PorT family protein [Tannerella sp.]
MNKLDKWEDIVRSKLKNFEVDVPPEDWNAILDRLPKMRTVHLSKRRYAVAAIAGIVLLSAGYFLFNREDKKEAIADMQKVEPAKDMPVLNHIPVEPSTRDKAENMPEEHRSVYEKTTSGKLNAGLKTNKSTTIDAASHFIAEKLAAEQVMLRMENRINKNYSDLKGLKYGADISLLAEAAPAYTPGNSEKRWRFGMGGGSYSVGTGGMAVPDFTFPSNLLSEESGVFKESANSQQKQDVSHKRPLSLGVGVGYALNDRWSLQSGLYYSMLRSEWWYVDECLGVSKQKLYFLGIPLSVNYSILEWNKFNLYATAGGMAEWNFKGWIKTDFYVDNKRKKAINYKKESIRMKEWQWSVNGKIGISYPLIRFVNAFVEGGANYYFDNGSMVETIRSEKPFHLSLQAGIRLGF